MHFVLARVHAGYFFTNGTVMKSGSQTKCAGNVPYLVKNVLIQKEYLIFLDKILKNSKFSKISFRMMKILKIGMFSLIFIEKTIVGLCLHNNYQSPYQLPSGPLILNSPTVDL